ncbi:MAG: ABC transporter ATP-binding protein [Lamprobacter sp.]|uniref:ABC transporter ATP-binding protein n=1 Tax=Lamprobacter sp. TaxID=3100796 RepID=UPI002B25E623|nr:ABC transporter ATP-binding protein [Lamprobacter sp.]MEA3638329.1 ABC transporter ATP-binding protein [Lamprobacter sp.]
MAFIELSDVTVLFPIYDAAGGSLKSALFGSAAGSRTGGEVVAEGRRRAVTGIRALDQVNLRLEHGDRLALIGHNGAGKSTLLRVLAGIYEPVTGSVQIEGTPVPMFNITLGMDIDSTGYENIVLRGLYLGLTRREIDTKVDEIADFSGLGSFLDLPMRTYSTGMRMRLAFSVCTAIRPDILLVDEGLGTGDAAFIEKAEARISRFSEEASILVLAAHNPPLLRKMCNRAVLLQHGHVIDQGSVEGMLKAYRALQTAA